MWHEYFYLETRVLGSFILHSSSENAANSALNDTNTADVCFFLLEVKEKWCGRKKGFSGSRSSNRGRVALWCGSLMTERVLRRLGRRGQGYPACWREWQDDRCLHMRPSLLYLPPHWLRALHREEVVTNGRWLASGLRDGWIERKHTESGFHHFRGHYNELHSLPGNTPTITAPL